MLKEKILCYVPESIRKKYFEGSARSKEAVKNIAISFVTKVVSILTSFLIVPLTINYVNSTQYGIWLSISSIIGWITYFNLGLGDGFRNRFAEAKAKGDTELARQYVSTTYFAVTCLVIVLFVIIIIANSFLDWAAILKVDSGYKEELHKVFLVLSFFFCLSMVVCLFSSLLSADQKPGIASIISTIGQLLSLFVVYILTKVSTGSLLNLALYYAGVPCIVTLIASVVLFGKPRYKKYSPKISYIKPQLIGGILNLGIQFFFINICTLLIFQIINIIISREIGPDAVTEYNIAYKYFHILYMFMAIIINPFWSAFTDAYAQKDYGWMKRTLSSLEKSWLICVAVGLVMLLISSWFYKFWLHESVSVSFSVSVALMVYMVVQTLGGIYMQLINGIGTIRIQLIIYLFFACISWPMVTYSCRYLGIYGAVLSPVIVYLTQALFCRIQLKKILSHSAAGLWAK